MKKLFLILFSFPLICFGQVPAGSLGNLSVYIGITVAVLAVLSFLLCLFLFAQIAGLKSKMDQFLRADKIKQDAELIKKKRLENEVPVISSPFSPYPTESTSPTEAALKEPLEIAKVDFVKLSEWDRAFDEVDRRIQALEDAMLGKQPFIAEKNAVEDTENIISEDPLQEQLRYAKMPDTDGSFNEDNFLSQQNGEQIYELHLEENEGTFSISNSADAQIYAQTDVRSYLQTACDYDTQGEKNSQIKTITPGKIYKQGSLWIISEKVKIEFV